MRICHQPDILHLPVEPVQKLWHAGPYCNPVPDVALEAGYVKVQPV